MRTRQSKDEAPLRAAVYARISDARDGDTAGVDRQEADCLAYCAAQDWTVIGVYPDNNESALTGKRPQYHRLLDHVRAGLVDVIVVYSADRLYRRLADLEELVDTLAGTQVVALRSGPVDLSTADGRMTARILGSVAQHESEKRGERVSRAAEDRARAGRYGGGKRRFGYTASADALVPAEADALRWAYAHVLAGGSLESCVREFRRRDLTGSEGARVSGTALRDWLLRPMNAGIAMYRGEEVGRTTAPPLVDEDTFRAVVALLKDPKRRTTVGRPPVSLLAPVLRCGVCGGRMSQRRRRRSYDRGGPDRIYACREAHVSRHADHLDLAVSELVLAYLDQHAERLRRPVAPARSTGAVEEADALRTRLTALSALVAAGDLDPADYARATRQVRDRLAEVERQMVRESGTPAAAAMVSSGDVREAWAAATVDERRAVVLELLDRITVSRGPRGVFSMAGVEPTWRGQADVAEERAS